MAGVAQLGDKAWLAETRAEYGAAEEMQMKKIVEDCLALKLQARDIGARRRSERAHQVLTSTLAR